MKNLVVIFFYSCLFIAAKCQVKLPALIRDSMILQREKPVKIWGWASPDEKIKVSFLNKKYHSKADANGNWMIHLPTMTAGGPYTMKIDASNHLTIKNILIGDVWICSGQSNMVHQMKLHSERYAKDITTASFPEIRQFYIATTTDLSGPKTDLPAGNWKSANPVDVLDFSAVAYFFAKKIYEKYHVPIGLINASVGGTPIEAWISEGGLKEFSFVLNTIHKNKDTAYISGMQKAAATAAKANGQAMPADVGLTGIKTWYDTTYIPTGWHQINIPGYWEDQGIKDLDGVVWYRKEIDVPQAMTGIPARVVLGRIVDADFLYVNGKLVGSTGYQYPQRRYQLPSGLLKAGKNILVIRVVNNNGKGGFVPGKPYYISAGNDTLDLKGYCQYKVGSVFAPGTFSYAGISQQNQPAALYNAMIAPITNYACKGICWYQGESNANEPGEYVKLLPAFVADWRKQWNADLPVLYVQLPNFMEVNYLPEESNWAMLREAQLKALSMPNTAMAVAIDLGEWNDIHPDNKKDIGERLALAAEKVAYGENNVVYSGPLYQSFKIEGNKIVVSFTNTGSGLTAIDGEALQQFAIAGADKKFVWANAKIEGNKVVVWSDKILNPLYVRYAWADNPGDANLYNKEGLPASPFRTDN